MKIFISAAFLLIFNILPAHAQTNLYQDISWLYQSEIIVGDEIMRIGVKEIYKDFQIRYWFHIKISEEKDTTFEILHDDFNDGDYLNKLLKLKIIDFYEGLPKLKK